MEEKDACNNAKRQEMRTKAQAELDNFIQQRQVRVQAKAATNREEEEAYLKQVSGDLSSGNPWERIASLVDLNKTDSGSQTSDISRLQHMLIQLKNAPLPAAAATEPVS